LNVLRSLVTLFAPGFAARIENEESVVFNDVKAEHFDVSVGWLRTCCSREKEVFKVAGHEVE
jgi:hypothetical protein